MNHDVTLYYDGGAGGVMFMLSFLLLTEQTHRSGWQRGLTTSEMIRRTWQIPGAPHSWKDAEILDDGVGDGVSKPYHQLTRYCNKRDLSIFQPPGSKTILLYAGADLHLQLARMKKPNWFYYNYYGLRDPVVFDWVQEENPNIKTFRDFEKLPTAQDKLNLVARVYLKRNPDWLLETDEQLNTIKKLPHLFQGNMTSNSAALLSKVDYAFSLEDVVQSRFACVTKALGLKDRIAVESHIDSWVRMHPEHIRRLLEGNA